jgi:hypothetical protein
MLTRSLCCTARYITALEILIAALEGVVLDWCESRPHNEGADRHSFNCAHGQAVMCPGFRVPEKGYFAVEFALWCRGCGMFVGRIGKNSNMILSTSKVDQSQLGSTDNFASA